MSAPTYKGNAGNLMQHWTLCELLSAAKGNGVTALNYIDAHAMAPYATNRTGSGDVFDRVRGGLPGQRSAYERAWGELAAGKGPGYPNSAAFVQEVWGGEVPMLLCEVDPDTVVEIESWAANNPSIAVYLGRWQERFKSPLPSPSDVGLSAESLTLVSFDPYIVSSRRTGPSAGNIYLQDLHTALTALGQVRGSVLIQLSTYSANDSNPQGAVIASTNALMVSFGFTLAAVVRTNGAMMSLAYERGIAWTAGLSDLPSRFTQWLGAVK